MLDRTLHNLNTESESEYIVFRKKHMYKFLETKKHVHKISIILGQTLYSNRFLDKITFHCFIRSYYFLKTERKEDKLSYGSLASSAKNKQLCTSMIIM